MTFQKKVVGKAKPGTKVAAKKPGAKPAAKKPAVKRARPKPFTYKAPGELKSHFVEVGFHVGKDGLIAPHEIWVESIKGKPDGDTAVRFDLLEMDPITAIALITRLHYRLFATNVTKRLSAGREWCVRIRVSVTGEGLIRARVVAAWATNAKGKLAELTDKTNPEYRKVRMASRLLAGAFVKARDQKDMLAEVKEQQAEERRAEKEAEREAAREAKASKKK